MYTSSGRYQVLLPRKADAPFLGESRKQAIQHFESNEKSVSRKGKWAAFQQVVQEYLDLGHAEPVSSASLSNPPNQWFYLPMHSIIKESSTSTKLRVVFDDSTKSSSNVSLNDLLLIGPTLFPSIDHILLHFRTYPVALTADISKIVPGSGASR